LLDPDLGLFIKVLELTQNLIDIAANVYASSTVFSVYLSKKKEPDSL
jgi:hypothetical protein